mmetsp:Transcript_54100/g.115518  ORF Transcript_54100/g.115518 Transcript_54100/m.115518 type:complete len:176 (+) Transcript_54100:92-619(+)
MDCVTSRKDRARRGAADGAAEVAGADAGGGNRDGNGDGEAGKARAASKESGEVVHCPLMGAEASKAIRRNWRRGGVGLLGVGEVAADVERAAVADDRDAGAGQGVVGVGDGDEGRTVEKSWGKRAQQCGGRGVRGLAGIAGQTEVEARRAALGVGKGMKTALVGHDSAANADAEE